MIRSSFGSLSLAQQTAALNLIYRDYSLAFQVGPEWVSEHLQAHQVDLERSPLWLDAAGNVIGAALLALRQGRAWVGGFGIAPAFRGRGFSHALLEEVVQAARQAEAGQIQLEVLLNNPRAQATYRRGGFEEVRQLVVLEGPGGPASLPFGQSGEPCWQRQRDSLQRLPRMLVSPTGLHQRDGQIYAVGPQSHWGELQFARRYRLSNEPVDSPLHRQVRGLGWSEVARQYEMLLRLG